MTTANTQAAKTLGSIAFANGLKCTPALDGGLVSFFKGREVGDKRTTEELKAWISGWAQSNISALSV